MFRIVSANSVCVCARARARTCVSVCVCVPMSVPVPVPVSVVLKSCRIAMYCSAYNRRSVRKMRAVRESLRICGCRTFQVTFKLELVSARSILSGQESQGSRVHPTNGSWLENLYVSVCIGRDFLRGDMRPSVHVRAHLIRGRVLCRLGADRRQEAAVSFETAASSANQVCTRLSLPCDRGRYSWYAFSSPRSMHTGC